MKYLWII